MFSSVYERLVAPLLFPQGNVCPLCESFIDSGGCICSHCEEALKQQLLPEERAAFRLPPLGHCLFVYAYRDTARRMIHLLKYHSAAMLAEPLGQAMSLRLIRERALYKRIDLVIPVPLHAVRQEERGYNQAEWLAKAMCAPCRLPLRPHLLTRTRETGSQVRRNRMQRIEAMRHAFAVTDPDAVKGKIILLVDDVFTTGATALSCAYALYASGAAEVNVITVCRA